MKAPHPIHEIAPILRGLLAQPTGNDDHPFRAPLIRTMAGDQSNSQSLRIELPGGEVTDETLRAHLSAAMADYETRHHAKPATVCLPGVGAFQSEHPGGDLPLAGKIALVTGAAGAIGYGICQGLIANGAYLAITDLPGEKFENFVREFQQLTPARVFGVPLDVTDPASVAGAFAQVIAQWGGVDLVVINAGIALAKPLVEIELEAFRRLERVNVEGTLLVLAEAGRHFARQNLGGDVVLISTKNVFAPGAGFGAYSATKAAAHQLARIASLEFAPLRVRVNMVAPDAVFAGGTHKSGLWAEVGPGRMKARGLDEKGLEEYYRSRNLLKARVTAEHVAKAVLFFATRQTPTTGACLPVDGGLPDATPR
ncbi:MAG: SDR family oxidoreductase [Opitutaceae bacterium]|nr:SDR family oxidoreductase [Opitutaceae bacterium]